MLAPMDNAICLSLFLRTWQPLVGLMVDSPLSSPLVLAASRHKVKLALLNARIPGGLTPPLTHQVLSKFDLVLPASELDYAQLSLAPGGGGDTQRMPGWCGDLSSASILGSGSWILSLPHEKDLCLLHQGLGKTPTWLAAHAHQGEEAVLAQIHLSLLSSRGLLPGGSKLRTIVVPAEGRWDQRFEIRDEFESRGLTVDSWTHPGATCESIDLPFYC